MHDASCFLRIILGCMLIVCMRSPLHTLFQTLTYVDQKACWPDMTDLTKTTDFPLTPFSNMAAKKAPAGSSGSSGNGQQQGGNGQQQGGNDQQQGSNDQQQGGNQQGGKAGNRRLLLSSRLLSSPTKPPVSSLTVAAATQHSGRGRELAGPGGGSKGSTTCTDPGMPYLCTDGTCTMDASMCTTSGTSDGSTTGSSTGGSTMGTTSGSTTGSNKCAGTAMPVSCSDGSCAAAASSCTTSSSTTTGDDKNTGQVPGAVAVYCPRNYKCTAETHSGQHWGDLRDDYAGRLCVNADIADNCEPATCCKQTFCSAFTCTGYVTWNKRIALPSPSTRLCKPNALAGTAALGGIDCVGVECCTSKCCMFAKLGRFVR